MQKNMIIKKFQIPISKSKIITKTLNGLNKFWLFFILVLVIWDFYILYKFYKNLMLNFG